MGSAYLLTHRSHQNPLPSHINQHRYRSIPSTNDPAIISIQVYLFRSIYIWYISNWILYTVNIFKHQFYTPLQPLLTIRPPPLLSLTIQHDTNSFGSGKPSLCIDNPALSDDEVRNYRPSLRSSRDQPQDDGAIWGSVNKKNEPKTW